MIHPFIFLFDKIMLNSGVTPKVICDRAADIQHSYSVKHGGLAQLFQFFAVLTAATIGRV